MTQVSHALPLQRGFTYDTNTTQARGILITQLLLDQVRKQLQHVGWMGSV